MQTADDIWLRSVRVYHERAAAERRQQWIDFYRCMEQLHTQLAAEHREKAEALMEPQALAHAYARTDTEAALTQTPEQRRLSKQ